MDLVFEDAFYWLFMSHTFTRLVIGSITFIALMIGFFHIIRKWGER